MNAAHRTMRLHFEKLEDRNLLHGCSVSFSSTVYSVGESGGTAQITLLRNFAAGDISVDFSAAVGTADGADFTPIASQTISWLDSDRNQKTVQVVISPDDVPEADETIELSLGNFQATSPGSPIAATLTIVDDDAVQAPSIANFGGGVTYPENGGAKPIAPSAVISDADSNDFDTGKLTVGYAAGGSADDRLSIRAGTNLSTSGNQLLFNGDLIGTLTGGTGTTPLTVTFNADATPAIATAVLRNVVYRNASDAPTSQRTVSVRMTDGDGGASAAVTKTISVTAVNDAPKLAISGSVGYVHNAASIKVAPKAVVTDVDGPHFNTGRLRVRITGTVNGSNRLAIGGGFTVDAGNQVFLGTTHIGTRTSNGVGTNELIVSFNTNATREIVQQLVRGISFRTSGGAAGNRNVLFSLTDGGNVVSIERTKVVNVT